MYYSIPVSRFFHVDFSRFLKPAKTTAVKQKEFLPAPLGAHMSASQTQLACR
jgi:hypothetical protein